MEVEKPSGRNKHVWEYLEYYIAFPHPPRYAVLLNGPWGIGKTFLVKKFLETHYEKRSEYVYLSLYGLSSIDEIDEALMAAIYPALTSTSAKIAGRVVKSALKYTGIEIDIGKKDFLGKFKAELYVFDDLERCEMQLNQVLGYINEFVEQDECKVVIIANEKEIDDIDDYRRRREKLIGKTLELESAFDEALEYFISLLDDSATRKFIQKKVDDISTIYHQSELHNLRILQQTLWDFERLFRVLLEEHRRNELAMSVLVRMFFVLSFEVKSGRMRPEDLNSRMEKIITGMITRSNEEAQPAPLQAAAKRYPDTHLDNSILSDELLTDILFRGVVSPTEIREYLDRSPYYVKPENEPSWRVLWHGIERPDDDFDRAFAEVERQFSAREFTITGEILHVLGLRLWLSSIGVLNQERAEIVKQGKAYIDDVYREKRLESTPLGDLRDVRFSGYGGLSMHEADTPEYRELFYYLMDSRKKADVDRYPQHVDELLRELQLDPDLYVRRLCVPSSGDSIYCRIPILASIDPQVFVDLVLQQIPSRQHVIMMAFKGRYEHGQLQRELAAEAPSLQGVRDKLRLCSSFHVSAWQVSNRALRSMVSRSIPQSAKRGRQTRELRQDSSWIGPTCRITRGSR